ncbi:DUF1351 domain-containing protein [Lacticaseibacillus mingshuiensis]|uniref:DUF1351 domain-containing protein n=1 Tax=Lacticaseibacillus mingshuiensis TaxID=2799574 RepID=UPI0019455D79|nr:DUF1351 domain-containing protein [Lacticaseibacillus mingshuiensis]
MTTNDSGTSMVAVDEIKYTVDYTPATIEFDHFDELKSQLLQYTQQFESMEVNEATVKEAKKVKSKLNGLKKQVNDRRISIHKTYEQPYDAFKQKVDELIGIIDKAVKPIDTAAGALAEQDRERKRQMVEQTINEVAPEYGIDPANVPVRPTWLNASTSQSTFIRELGQDLLGIQDHAKKVIADREAVKAYAAANDMDPSGWLAQIDDHTSFVDIRPRMDTAMIQRKQEAEAAQKRAEAAAAVAALNQEQIGEKTVDTETGEVVAVEQMELEPEPKQDERKFVRAFRITATADQMWALADWMKANGIDYEPIKEARP